MDDRNRLDRARIVPLTRLPGHRLTGEEPDVRGWTVFGSDGRRIGGVDDLLVDTASGRVRYLDVDLEHDLYARAGAPEPSSAIEEEQGEVLAQEVAAGLGVGLTAPRSPARNTPTGEARAGMGPMTEHLVRESLVRRGKPADRRATPPSPEPAYTDPPGDRAPREGLAGRPPGTPARRARRPAGVRRRGARGGRGRGPAAEVQPGGGEQPYLRGVSNFGFVPRWRGAGRRCRRSISFRRPVSRDGEPPS